MHAIMVVNLYMHI